MNTATIPAQKVPRISKSVFPDSVMNKKLGIITMIISATSMGFVPLFSRWATRKDFYSSTDGLNAGQSVGALMAVGRMAMGVLFFLILLFVTHKASLLKKHKLSPAIALGGLMIGMSLACYVTATLLTTITNSVLFIYTGPVICVVLARIFRKEPMNWLSWVCLCAVFIGMLFGNGIVGFNEHGTFMATINLDFSTSAYPLKGIGDFFAILSGVFYGASMFFNGYRKDCDTVVRGVWNFIFAVGGAGVITLTLHLVGVYASFEGSKQWALNLHLTGWNWLGAFLFWIICGPLALGLLLVAGKNLPAADYGTIAYWEVPVALFIGIVIFSEPFSINTVIAVILIIGGGAVPSIRTMFSSKRRIEPVT